jgi:preprotein translocase subunit SecY
MSDFIHKLKLIFEDKSLRKRILFVISGLIIFRFLANVPIPSIDKLRLEQFFANNQFFGFLDIFAGGGLSNLSVVMLGVGPYITASIIMQLMTMIFPKLKEMYQEQGELGRKKFSQYSRMLTLPLAAVQAFAFLTLLSRQGVIEPLIGFDLILNIVIVTAGSILLMWLGELITEFGISSGISLIIFAGIVAGIPAAVTQLAFTFAPELLPIYLGFIVAGLLIIWGVVIVTEAERPIPITYAKRVRGMKIYGGISTYLPLRINQAGVIPIIFALSILLFPQMIFTFLSTWLTNPTLISAATFVMNIISNQWVYSVIYFALIFLFTYFYTAVTFDPNQISDNLQKNGAFVPGVRPGRPTSEYIARILNRITLVGATFLGLVAVLPLAIQAATGITAIAIGGTSLLIVVSVAIDLIKKIDAQISMREY